MISNIFSHLYCACFAKSHCIKKSRAHRKEAARALSFNNPIDLHKREYSFKLVAKVFFFSFPFFLVLLLLPKQSRGPKFGIECPAADLM
jgi:hypothetical protein